MPTAATFCCLGRKIIQKKCKEIFHYIRYINKCHHLLYPSHNISYKNGTDEITIFIIEPSTNCSLFSCNMHILR